jgi:hypothetical protein
MSNANIAEAGMGTTLLGGGLGAIGSFMGGLAQQQMYDYQAGVAMMNAQISQQNATYALNVGEIQAANAGLAAGQRLGQIKAAHSASGLDVNTGSAAQVRASQKEVSGMDVAAIRSNAAKTAYNYQVQGVQYAAQAQLDTFAGQNARSAGLINAGSSIIGAASSVSNEWLRGQSLGLWGSPGGGSGSASTTFGN